MDDLDSRSPMERARIAAARIGIDRLADVLSDTSDPVEALETSDLSGPWVDVLADALEVLVLEEDRSVDVELVEGVPAANERHEFE